MTKTKSRAKKFAEWEEKTATDYDPEAEVPDQSDSATNSDDSSDENDGTEHYVAVGKSKLRGKEAPSLGPQYRGTRVSRDALDQSESDSDSDDFEDAREEFDDPEEVDLGKDQQKDEDDAEIDSGDAFADSDAEKFKDYMFRGSSQVAPAKGKKVSRPTAADFLDDGSEEEDDDDEENVPEGSDEEKDEEDEDKDNELAENPMFDAEAESTDNDEGDDEEDGLEDSEVQGSNGSDEHEEMFDTEGAVHGALSSQGEDDEESEDEAPKKSSGTNQNIARSLVNAVHRDASRGIAVRRQRQAFDAALNIRIRLQKALVAANSFDTVDGDSEQSEPYEGAEAAAVKLWNAIDTFRTGMQVKIGEKRKRSIETSTPSKDIWDSMQSTEQLARVRRKTILDNWSGKVKNVRANDSAGGKADRNLFKVEKPLTVMLEDQLQDTERLVKRTKVPRSCAPAQSVKKVDEDSGIYDDADFYQLMLKELVDQRTVDTSSAAVGGQAATVRYAASKEAKTKKQVDTKASKGRKMRFNVHEKLQHFMAPEDRRSWEQPAIDRFFGTLFGQKMILDDNVSDDEMGDANGEVVEGLRLF